MSQPKLISPLLDGFVMGDPISSHNGVRCCPAMDVQTGKKYIVKIVSIPASQTKLEALLLAGAFSDKTAALEYFKELADGVVEEAVLLQRLSRQEGFIPYDNWQIVPMEDGTGFDVYLLAPYRPTLDRMLRKNATTHLEAVNLGLDLCAALAACRRSGYLYTDLRPGNIYVSDDREYRIGDLGFINLASLNFASLPDKYHSPYTPPEIADAYSALNETMDVYALGMILYQTYNDGLLPDPIAPGELLNAPVYADGQMAQIILKACAPNPGDRWQSPAQMGQALVSYMQTNRINDVPIIPAATENPLIPEEPVPDAPADELQTDDILAQVDEALSIEDTFGTPMEETPAEEENIEETPVEEDTAGETAEEASAEDTVPEEAPIAEEAAEEAPIEEEAAEEAPIEEEAPEEAPVEEEAPEEAPVEEEAPEEAPIEEEAVPEVPMTWEDTMVSQEIADILEQADDLIAHELPDPVVAPEPIDVPIPVPAVPQEETPEEIAESSEETTAEAAAPESQQVQPQADQTDDAPAEEDFPLDDSEPIQKPKRKFRKLIIILLVLLLLAGAAFAGYYYYNNYYIQTVTGMQLNGTEDKLTVTLDTDVDNTILTVYCTDTYGNTLQSDVVNNVADFSGLKPNTRYDVYVKISGNHKLTGITASSHTTSEQTTISGLSAITGSEDGSVILSFAVEGPETSGWNVFYSCDTEAEKSLAFTDHIVTLTGLTPGKEYTFRIEPSVPLYMVGENTITFTASKLIFAQDLVIQSLRSNVLTAVWNAPEDAQVESWTVRCYNASGFDKTITVDSTTASFDLLDPTTAYTVEVSAAGMTQCERAYVTENTVTLLSHTIDDSTLNQLTLSWEYEGPAPEGGWYVMYTCTGYTEQQIVRTATNSAVITPVIPGASYSFDIQPASGCTFFGEEISYSASEAPTFQGYWLEASNLLFQMCPTPENPNWGKADVDEGDFTTTFAPGVSASFAITVNHEYDVSFDNILTLVVFRDASGNVVSTTSHTRTWISMWYQGFGKLDLPSLPTTVGDYSVEIYYNGALVTIQNFTIALPETT